MKKDIRDKLREMGAERIEGAKAPDGTEAWRLPDQTRDQLKRMREICDNAEKQRIKDENTTIYVEGSPGLPRVQRRPRR